MSQNIFQKSLSRHRFYVFTSVFENFWWTLKIACIVSDFIEWFELLFAIVGCILHNIVMPPTQGGLGWAGLVAGHSENKN